MEKSEEHWICRNVRCAKRIEPGGDIAVVDGVATCVVCEHQLIRPLFDDREFAETKKCLDMARASKDKVAADELWMLISDYLTRRRAEAFQKAKIEHAIIKQEMMAKFEAHRRSRP